MKRRAARALVGALLIGGCGLKPAKEPTSERAVLFILADLRGYLGPCGCSERMRGGIARAAFQVAEARRSKDPVFVVDGGDSLFDFGAPAPAEVPEVERRAQALAEALKQMGLVARGIGPLDNARGEAFRKNLALPEPGGGGFQILEVRPHRLAVAFGSDLAQLATAAAAARRQGAVWVLGVVAQPLESVQGKTGALQDSVDLIVTAHAASELSAEESRMVRSDVPLAQLQSKGRSLLRLDLRLGAEGGTKLLLAKTGEDQAKEIATLDARLALLGKELDAPALRPERKVLLSRKMDELVARRQKLLLAPEEQSGAPAFSARFIPLESSLPQDASTSTVLERYDRDVGELNLAWAKAHGKDCPAPGPGEPSEIGSEACLACHPQARAVWQSSKHAHAYETLRAVKKHLHTACVGCHVTGYGQPGGVCRIDRVSDRANVGCESCHGGGSAHAAAPARVKIERPSEGRCVSCHTPENSPHFDYPLYLRQVLGPGHGQPLPGRPAPVHKR